MLSPEQMEIRRTRVGGSEIGALIGADPYKTATKVFTRKMFPDLPEEPEDHLAWGHFMEPGVLAWHKRRGNFERLLDPGTMLHEKHPAICATPDAIGERLVGPMVVIEAKSSQWHQADKWGEPGTDHAPLLYVAQVTMELGIAIADTEGIDPVADLVVSIAGAPPVVYKIGFDAELFGRLVYVAEKFVRDHLETGRPPEKWEVDTAAAEYLEKRYPKDNGLLLPATDEARTLAASVAMMRATAKVCNEEKEAAEVRLKDLIGDASGFEGICTWKKSKDTIETVTDWQAIARPLLLTVPAEQHKQLLEKHTQQLTTRKGSRRLLLAKEK